MANYLITGASRGIGLELTKQLLSLPTSQVSKVFAVARSNPSALQDLMKQHQDRAIHISACIDDTASIQKAATEVKTRLGTEGLDVLVNNAGVSVVSPGGIKTLSAEDLAHVFDVNVVGTHRTIAAFLPLLEVGKLKKVISISSTLGSIALVDNFKAAPTPAYKISKTALNMLNAQYALDHAEAGFTFLCVSPGWLKTDLGGNYADLSVEVGVTALKKIILESDKSQNGKFVDIHLPEQKFAWGQYQGGELPW